MSNQVIRIGNSSAARAQRAADAVALHELLDRIERSAAQAD